MTEVVVRNVIAMNHVKDMNVPQEPHVKLILLMEHKSHTG